MFYREAGEFKTSYAADHATFPIAFDFWRFWVLIAFAFLIVPVFINDYWEQSIFLPFLVFSMAALGLNILTGYCGLVSLGTGAFMACGAYAGLQVHDRLSGAADAASWSSPRGRSPRWSASSSACRALRIKGFYLAVATLAAQFFLIWVFNKFGWFYNYSATGQITAPEREILGVLVTGPNTEPWATYLFCLCFVFVFGWIARNLVRGRIGRSWMAIRDMDIAAEIIGVNPLLTKLSAFAVSPSTSAWPARSTSRSGKGAAEGTEAFSIDISFEVLFMVILGGPRLDLRLLRGRGLPHAPAGALQEHPGGSVRLAHRYRRAAADHPDRRADHLLPHQGAARHRGALAHDEGEASALALPILSGQSKT